MDLYIPQTKSAKEREVFVIIHGGGWQQVINLNSLSSRFR
jgi:acetyl esterase/lipase